jgi:hypothetical protein
VIFLISIIVVIGTSIWVYRDARKIESQEGGPGDPNHTVPGGWLIGCLAFWIVCFPIYLGSRGNRKLNGEKGSPVGVRTVGLCLVGLILILAVISVLDWKAKGEAGVAAVRAEKNIVTETPVPEPIETESEYKASTKEILGTQNKMDLLP